MQDPTETFPTIKTSLGFWMKSDPKAMQAPVFDDDEPEEFIAYADNTPENLLAKASALLYLTCAGRKGELQDMSWDDIAQERVDGRLVWTISYIREKQQDRPERAKSILGDEISNLAFTLYAGKNKSSLVYFQVKA